MYALLYAAMFEGQSTYRLRGYEDEETLVYLRAAGATLVGNAKLPARAAGLVVIALDSDTGRHSLRIRSLARTLDAAEFGTLVLDLLTPGEARCKEETGAQVDLDVLTDRLIAASDWMLSARSNAEGKLPLGYFASGRAAYAALHAARARPGAVRALVLSQPNQEDILPLEVAGIDAARLVLEAPGSPEASSDLDGQISGRATREWFERHLGRSGTGHSQRDLRRVSPIHA